MGLVEPRASGRAHTEQAPGRRRRARKVGGAVMALGVAGTGVVTGAELVAAACAVSTHEHSGQEIFYPGTIRNFHFSNERTKAPRSQGCRDTNVSHSTMSSRMQGRYYSNGPWRWANAQPDVYVGEISPWKVLISDLADGTRFNHGHGRKNAWTTWRY